jgi:acyl-CoA dehydrogenase
MRTCFKLCIYAYVINLLLRSSTKRVRLPITEYHNIIREKYRKFLQKETQPYLEAWREAGIVPRKMFKKFGPQGFLLTWAEEKYGGLGVADFRYQQIMQEEDAAYSDAGFYHTLHGRLVAPYISNFSNEEQKSFFYLRVFSVRKFSL